MKATIKIEGETFSELATAIHVALTYLKKTFKDVPNGDLADIKKATCGHDFYDDNCYGSVEMKIRQR